MSDIEEEKKITPYILCFDEAHKLCPLKFAPLSWAPCHAWSTFYNHLMLSFGLMIKDPGMATK